ncbi:SH2 domain-containing protein [Caenorhabditis elegans]|uniref:SH2 domain-containing protein n=2 Tax=Caenorhabditis elegans TaxID=6239 RepID=H2L092_CAEEL|nr:SH2 domain-containing protein [Caenorhabditis elegans]CCD72093.1 SH2 domain-containing protein [Caenorhabditis elegans]|eukprot:NP_494915.2 SHC (Src Homology domain C-terminal) adaptor homolog [Caenorhabditis elegans]
MPVLSKLARKMYSRLKSSLLNHFQKGANSSSNPSYNGLTKEEKKRLRHSLAECQLNDVYDPDSAHSSYQHSVSFVTTKPSSRHHQQTIDTSGHAPLAPQEVYLDETSSNSASTFYSDLLASSFSSAGGNSSFTCDYEDTNETSFIMSSGLPALSWNVQYIGSFPISGSYVDNLGRRIDSFQPTTSGGMQSVELSISVLGVKICCEKTVLMSHSLRRVTDISARPDTQNIGYVATEPVGRTYRRLCHVFHCQSLKEAEEIENVLRNANQSQVLAAKQPKSAVSTSSMHPTNTASTMTEKRSASTVFLNRFLGKKGSQTVDESGQCKRKRRPVSAVFSSAIHRLSSSTSSVNPKRMSTIEPQAPTREQLLQLQNQMRCAASSPVPEEPRPTDLCAASTTTSTSSVASSSSSNGSSSSTDTSPVPPAPQTALVYDEKLGEWIYPIDQALMTQLDNCSYFVGQPTKDSMVYNLNTQPEGAFVIRYSESKSKCLALSMRVPCSHNPSGISHYLIIRNEQGFRLKLSATKKPFPTLQMMLTHHSVLESHLPCTLHFVQWQKTNFKQLAAMSTVERPLRTFNRHSTALTKIDENRNVTATSTPYRPSGRCGGGIDDFTTPKNRRTRNEINAMRRSHFFDDRQIVL